jgi:tight adherence protein C
VLFAALLSFEKLLPIAIFGLFAVVTWWLLGIVAGRRSRADERLDEFSNPAKRGEKAKKGSVSSMLEKATPALAKPLQPKNEQEVSKLKLRLTQGGFRSETAPSIFLGLKFIGLIAGLFVCGGPMLLINGANQKTLIYVVLTAGGLFYLPDIVVWWVSRSRKQQIFLSLPDALDLLVVCVEAGLGLDQAMRKVSEEMKRTARVICEEFNLCNFQLQMGRGRAEVLHELVSGPAWTTCEPWRRS